MTDEITVVALATGVIAILAVIALGLLFLLGQPFGSANDLLNAAIGVSSAILSLLVWRAHGGPSIATGLALIGALVTVVGSWLVMSGATGFQLAGFVSAVGFALIGGWLILETVSGGLGTALPVLPSRLALVAGAVMLVGLLGIAGIALRIDSVAATPWWLWAYGISWLGTYILYPAWCIRVWLSR